MMNTMQLYARKQWLMAQRKKLNWGPEEVAKRLGVTVTEYVAFEDGRTETHPDIDFLELKFYFESKLQSLCLEGDPHVHMDRFER